jgi:hypothetical protein
VTGSPAHREFATACLASMIVPARWTSALELRPSASKSTWLQEVNMNIFSSHETKRVLPFLTLSLSVLAASAFSHDRTTIQNYMNQIQSLRADIDKEQKNQQDLLKTKELLLEGDRINREETTKLKLDSAKFQADIDAHKAKRASLTEE